MIQLESADFSKKLAN